VFATLLKTAACVALFAAPARADSPDAPRADRSVESSRKVDKMLGEALRALEGRRLGAAADAFEAVLELEPRNVTALVGLAFVENGRGNHERALSRATRALEADKGNSFALREAGYALWKGGKRADRELAAKALALAIDRDPTNWPAYDYLAAMFEEAGNDKAADAVRDLKAKEKAREPAKKGDARRYD
jgi:predicted Zn-dependent protease